MVVVEGVVKQTNIMLVVNYNANLKVGSSISNSNISMKVN